MLEPRLIVASLTSPTQLLNNHITNPVDIKRKKTTFNALNWIKQCGIDN